MTSDRDVADGITRWWFGEEDAGLIIACDLRGRIEAALAKVREEENEACAKVADRQAAHDPAVIGNADERVTHRHCAMDIAAAIRSRQTPTGTGETK